MPYRLGIFHKTGIPVGHLTIILDQVLMILPGLLHLLMILEQDRMVPILIITIELDHIPLTLVIIPHIQPVTVTSTI